jgi:membrane associated rhomboid family serine protease
VTNGALAALYVVVLAAGVAAQQAPGAPDRPNGRRRPWATLVALLMVGVVTTVQLVAVPDLLGALGRTPDELAGGQPYRLVTALTVQDGGWSGGVFNLAALAVVGGTAEAFWRPGRWWTIWLAAGVGAQFWGLLVQPSGAGNSVATFGLAASLAAVAVVRGRGPARVAGVVSLLGGLTLLVARDIHGGAVLIGALAGGLLSPRTRPPSRAR